MNNAACPVYPVTLTPAVVAEMLAVSDLVGRIKGIRLDKPVPKLRDKNRSRSVHGSSAIEGNRCTLEQVEAIAKGLPAAVPATDRREVKNALDAYHALPRFDPTSLGSLLKAHAMLMKDVAIDAGFLRRQPVEVYITKKKTMAMPDWRAVEPGIRSLLDYVRQSKDPILLKSVRFHFEFVNLHPFTDGNGRTARLWQTRVLMELYPVFEFLDVESMIYEKRAAYYAAIRQSQEEKDSAPFAAFMIGRILESLSRLWEQCGGVTLRAKDRLQNARGHFGGTVFSRRDYLALFKTITAVTASRDLASGVQSGDLLRAGDKRTATYRFGPANR